LASIKDPTNSYACQGTYDASHRLTQTTDRATTTWKYVYDFAGKLASDSTPSVAVDTTITGTGALVTRRLGSKIASLESAELIDPGSGKGTSSNPGSQILSASVRAVTYGMPLETTTAHATRLALDRFLTPLRIEQDSLADTTFLTRDANEHVTRTLERRKQKTVASDTTTFGGPRVTRVTNLVTGSSITYAYDTTYDLVKRISGSTQTVQNYLNSTKIRIDSTRVGSNPDSTKDSVSVFAYNAKGRITLSIDPKQDSVLAFIGSSGFQNTDSTSTGPRTTRFLYDGWGRLARTVNPKGDTVILALNNLIARTRSTRLAQEWSTRTIHSDAWCN
jgi:YD repeat-containing protein